MLQADSEGCRLPAECKTGREDNLKETLCIRELFIFCLSNITKWRTSKMMPYGDPLSHIRNMKGIVEELPLVRLKYLPAQNDTARKTNTGNALVVRSLDESDTGSQAEPIRINYTSSTGRASFGTDQMVSYASVIHELAYGRVSSDTRQNASGEIGYPIPREYMRHSLDIVV